MDGERSRQAWLASRLLGSSLKASVRRGAQAMPSVSKKRLYVVMAREGKHQAEMKGVALVRGLSCCGPKVALGSLKWGLRSVHLVPLCPAQCLADPGLNPS